MSNVQAINAPTAEHENTQIAPTARIYPNVRLGRNVVIEDFCIVGYPPRGVQPGELETVIGDNTVVRSHTVIYAGVEIGTGCQISHNAFIREHTRIGHRSSVGTNVIIEHHCTLGERVRLQGQAGLSEYTTVEDDAWIGPRVVTTNVPHPGCEKAKECLAGPIIRKHAIIGAAVTLSPDTDIGEHSFIGAGSVVTKAVESGTMMFGVPAKKIGMVDALSCRYDMMDGKKPYAVENQPVIPPDTIPLVDLAAQHQNHKQDIRLAIDKVVNNTRFINGKEVGEFEAHFAGFCGAKYCIGVSNGTDALRLALHALDIGPGDEVITTPHTFIATVEAILAVGATPIFADVDEATLTLEPDEILKRITPRTKAIVPVHIHGQLAPMPEIMEIARAHGLKVVEDAAQSHGASIGGKRCGQWGDAASFSFFPGKNLGAYGDAGGVVTDDDAIAKRIGMLRDHGRVSKYLHEIVGANYRLDTLQAAVLDVKLKRLDKWNEARRRWAELYREMLQGLPVALPAVRPGYEHVYHQFVIRTPDRDGLMEHLKNHGIASGVHYPVPLHRQPALAFLGYRGGDFPVTERAAQTVLSLPMYPELDEKKIERIAHAIRSFYAQ